MRFNIFFCLLAIVSVEAAGQPILRVNYDPYHKPITETGIQSDFNQIAANGFKVVKTYTSLIGDFDLAKYACNAKLQIMLGVWEDNDPAKTAKDVANVKQTIQKNRCIIGIVVGNEDVDKKDSNNQSFAIRIKNDVIEIQNAIKKAGLTIPVGTAQLETSLLYPNPDTKQLIPVLNFIGVNIHPYFDANVPPIARKDMEPCLNPNKNKLSDDDKKKCNWLLSLGTWVPFEGGYGLSQTDPQAKTTNMGMVNDNFNSRLKKITDAYPKNKYKIIVTEEGWPSQTDGSTKPTSSTLSQAYFQNWLKNRVDVENYYFSFFDKIANLPGAESHFGLCTANGQPKDKPAISCKTSNGLQSSRHK